MDEERLRRDMIRRDYNDKIAVMEYANWLYEYKMSTFTGACRKALTCKRYWKWIRTRDDAMQLLQGPRRFSRRMRHAIRAIAGVSLTSLTVVYLVPGRSPPRVGLMSESKRQCHLLSGIRISVGVDWVLRLYRSCRWSDMRPNTSGSTPLMSVLFFRPVKGRSPYAEFEEGNYEEILSCPQ